MSKHLKDKRTHAFQQLSFARDLTSRPQIKVFRPDESRVGSILRFPLRVFVLAVGRSRKIKLTLEVAGETPRSICLRNGVGAECWFRKEEVTEVFIRNGDLDIPTGDWYVNCWAALHAGFI